MRERWRWQAFVVGVMSSLPARALADVPVFPQRPEWDDTPVPMPPELVAILLVAIAFGLVVALARRGSRD